MPKIPDHQAFAHAWANVSTSDRRRIVRTVNRGEVLEDRREAALGVVLARRQQRFWRVAWMLGPVIALVVSLALGLGSELVQLVATSLMGTAVLMGMSAFYLRRARQAERLNTDRAVHGRRPDA